MVVGDVYILSRNVREHCVKKNLILVIGVSVL